MILVVLKRLILQ